MRFSLTTGKGWRTKDVKTYCERAELRADTPEEAAELAKFMDALIHGRPATFQILPRESSKKSRKRRK